MELGAKNRKEVIALVVLGVIGSITTARMFLSSPGPPPVTGPQIAANTAKPAMQRTASGKFVKLPEPRLDPTLDLDLLRQNEQIKYAGNARNIFVAGSMPEAMGNGTTDHRKKKPEPPPQPVVIPPPPIELKFFGFASKPGEPKKIFLSHGEDIFIASEGDIVNRRYRVLRISPAAVDIEDVLNNNRQSIPLTQG